MDRWDPQRQGVLSEPHHNTYDIEFWGPEPMCSSIYLGAMEAMIAMGSYLGEEVTEYQTLLAKGKAYLENQLFNGQYFYQRVEWKGLKTPDSVAFEDVLSPEAKALVAREGPNYQYGSGCLSDGMIGAWETELYGLPAPLDTAFIGRHLQSVFRYNFKTDLSGYPNPQRPGFALGHEGGLLLCSWPEGGRPSLPFVYSNEVWTGVEYEAASHLIMTGRVREGLAIVRAVRRRYDGRVRNPFDEYEAGNWYARAMSSYALIQALTGVRYDAVEKCLYINSKIGDFRSFLSTATGFGSVTYRNGKVALDVVYGKITVNKIVNQTPK